MADRDPGVLHRGGREQVGLRENVPLPAEVGGRSVIRNVQQVDRGYERVDERLRSLGARISRE